MRSCATFLPHRWLAVAVVLGFLALVPGTARGQVNPWVDFLRPTFQKHCTKCHGEKDKVKGKVNLLELKSADHLAENLTLLEDMIDVLELGEMPPTKEAQLPPEVRTRLVNDLRSVLNQAVRKEKPYPPTPIRRMNRFQYNNAAQDLFELKANVFSLPERMMRDHSGYFKPASGKVPDKVTVGSRPLGKSQMIEKRLAGVAAFPQDLRAEHGFDNRGDHLTLSPILLESFLKLSHSIVVSKDFHAKNVGIWKTFFAKPPDNSELESEVRARLRPFLSRAFRRPVEAGLLDGYAALVLNRVQSGHSFTDGMKDAATAVLASPRFFYLHEQAATAGTSQPVDDFELASRLSFFLWGSIPDQELLDVAARGKLRSPEILQEQVGRMLNDPKLKRFCDSFPSQWLQLERIITATPDRQLFPQFYHAKYHGSAHMMLEPLMVFETILIEDRPILELVHSDFSYRSPYLSALYRDGGKAARNFGVGNVPLTRVKVSNRMEGGIMTTAAVMTMTSAPTRTKPITRGAWVAGVIFNQPPEPPPADVPALPENGPKGTEHLSLREQIAEHRTRADCAGCHARIDPLGFALEKYGPAGTRRQKYPNGATIESSGSLFGRHQFEDLAGFKEAILAEKDRFARGFAAHLLSFALGRAVSPADSAALDQIVKETAKHDYRMRALIHQIALSEPFLLKSNPAAAPEDSPAQTAHEN